MKKNVLNYLVFAALIFSAALMVSCKGKELDFKVTFQTNGGSEVPAQTVKQGELVARPGNPTKENHTFGGWYKESELTNEWDFSADRVNSDITLYAKWDVDGFIITAVVENGNTYNGIIRRVRAASYDSSDDVIHAVGTYSNGGFSLSLPPTVNNQDLLSVDEYFYGLTISNRSARVTTVDIEAWTSASGGWNWSHWLDDFVYGKIDISNVSLSGTMAMFFYADRDVTVKGSEHWTNEEYYVEEKIDLTLKKGWNIVYVTDRMDDVSYILEATTTPVSGLKWYLEDDFENILYGMMSDTHQLTKRLSSDVKSQMFKTPLFPKKKAAKAK